MLTVLKKELLWLKEVDSIPLQAELQNLDAASQGFFRRVKKGEKPGYPRFKSKRNRRKSYKRKQHINNGKPTIWIDAGHIRLLKLGLVKCRVSKEVKRPILSATVSQNPSGKYFVALCCTDIEIEPLSSTGAVVGLDMGLKAFAITSDGVEYPNHKFLSKSLRKLARLQRQLSQKSKGSKRREKARVTVARLQEHVANQRQDTIHKLARSISDASWGEFRRQLKYKAAWYGKVVAMVDRFYPSSQLCSTYGAQWPGTKDLSVREWTCPVCGAHHLRDVNAAQNILNEGLRLVV